jgi:hypothetical protein
MTALSVVVAVTVPAFLFSPVAFSGASLLTTRSAHVRHSDAVVTVPSTPVGKQLTWLLSIASLLPLRAKEIGAHFDSAFLSQISPDVLNEALESLGPPGSKVSLLKLEDVETSSLVALLAIGSDRYSVQLSVDHTGLIDGLLFKPITSAVKTWSQIDSELAKIAPGVSFLAARLSPTGTCVSVHSIQAATPRPLGSMFKLFVLGALANAVKAHKITWSEVLTVTAAIKVGGSGTLQDEPDGTKISVEQTAIKMISLSDNTAADMLLKLVGRTAVEQQVKRWSSHPSLDIPFLTVSEMFALKYHDFPAFADRYLALKPAMRAAFLATSVDSIPESAEASASSPRDINAIEWFASADDVCRALSGLSSLQGEAGLSPINTVLSTNNGGIGLDASTWPRVWFKGGSEPGVLTLGYLARDSAGKSFAVIVLTEDPLKAVQASIAVEVEALKVISASFGLLHQGAGG